MGIVLILSAALAYWAWRTRETQALRLGDVAAVVAALIGLRFLSRGAELTGLLALAGAGWWGWFRRGGKGFRRPMSRDDARRLLDLPRDYTADEVRAAHRRLVARVHPDVGGSSDLAGQVNAARDLLLRRRT